MQDGTPVPVGCQPIDELLGGGLERGTVTQVYGPPGAGKTNVALSAAVTAAAAEERALFIDTEGLSAERLEQLAAGVVGADEVAAVTDRVLVSAAHDFDEQAEAVREAAAVAPGAGLIALDSATGFYRLRRREDPEDAVGETLRLVADQVAHLLGLARRHDLAVVITNQVFTDPDAGAIRPLGGHTLAHWCGTIVRVERFRGGNRRVVLEKHRSRSVGDAVRVRITEGGFEGVADP
ncbi:MAG: DNA repair and recombination protein RadB [Halobacteriales archaeon]